ncbi:CvpA family protein [Aliikangiella maris]|uniref:CvpA family protein n=2 Tax=Aliikangiella maris TaxID=3162458 RepID=A0ABV3MM07_9GAMM
MQWVDWAILIIICISAGVSLLRGFVREALSLAGWIVAFFIAKGFYQDVALLLEDQIDTPSLRYGVAWAALFFITLTVTGLINYIIGKLVEKAGLSGMDRIMGMAFGALRGILVVSVAVITLNAFTLVQQDPWWKKSRLIPHVEMIGNWFYDHFKDSIPDVNRKLTSEQNS